MVFSYSISLLDIDILGIAFSQKLAEKEYAENEAKVLIRLHFELLGRDFASSEEKR
jgi:hypothetical protein